MAKHKETILNIDTNQCQLFSPLLQLHLLHNGSSCATFPREFVFTVVSVNRANWLRIVEITMARTQNITFYDDIDWQLLWKNSRETKSWKSKNAGEWSQKSATFAQRTRHSPYVRQFLDIVAVDRETTLLDVGCGPGTLAVPFARNVSRVTAIDYSKGMLDQLEAYARDEGVHNITTDQCAWEDNWEEKQIGRHDLVIASRSMTLEALEAGIEKLQNHAVSQLVSAERIAPTPYDPDAFAAIGRSFSSGPDYIYTMNMLHHLDIHPRIDHIELTAEPFFKDLDEAIQSYRWMFRDLSEEEERKLALFVSSRIIRTGDDGIVIRRNYPQRWALLSWLKKA